MSQRKERADALRNRESVLAAADALFARGESPHTVSMDEVAAAAGVGKGTLFRRFGDRAGLIGAVIEARLEPVRRTVREQQTEQDVPPRERVLALLDAVLRFKLDNRHLTAAAEHAGANSPYQADHYAWWHDTLREALEQVPGVADAEFTAHALLAATRADLVTYLVDERGMPPKRLRKSLAAHVATVLGEGEPGDG